MYPSKTEGENSKVNSGLCVSRLKVYLRERCDVSPNGHISVRTLSVGGKLSLCRKVFYYSQLLKKANYFILDSIEDTFKYLLKGLNLKTYVNR